MAATRQQLWAVVPAAGSGSRFGAGLPKQYQVLAGKSVLEHSLSRLLEIEEITQIIVALSADDPHFAELPVARNPRVKVIAGGAQRSDSVRLALAAIQQAQDDDWVLVHDAARPCVSSVDIQRLVDTCRSKRQGGLLALPVVDTLKRATDGRVSETVDRSGLWRALTPQLFQYGPLSAALDTCNKQNQEVTDEASAMEQCGYRPLLVEGNHRNIKITYADDLALAAYYLQETLN